MSEPLVLLIGAGLMASWAFFAWIGYSLGEDYGRFTQRLDEARKSGNS